MTSTTIIGKTSKTRKPPTFDALRAQCAAAGLPTARALDCNIVLVPSATTPGQTYIVLFFPTGQIQCSCAARRPCWHIARSLELGGRARVLRAVALVNGGEAERAAIIARGRAAVDDLCGTAA